MVEGPHCLLCKHQAACVLPQKASGQVCGWYNACVRTMIDRAPRPAHTLTVPAHQVSYAPGAPPARDLPTPATRSARRR